MFTIMRLLLCLSVVGITGCTTARITPKVEAFGTATTAQAKASRDYLEKKRIEAATQKRRRQAIALRGGFYDFTGCRPIEVNKAPLDVETKKLRYAERCPLVPVLANDDGDVVPLDMSDYEGVTETAAKALLQEAREDDDSLRNGLRVAAGLEAYSQALLDLTTSEDPQELAESFKTAADAIDAAAKAVAKADGEAIDEGVFAFSSEASALAEKYLKQALEAARYDAIRRLVLGSDKTVGFAARLVALHIDHFERDEHNALYRDLEDKAFALEAAYDDGEEGDAILTRIAAVEDAKAALDEADEKRIALKTLGIARTHAAIAHSLREGAEFDDILAAQQTIIELVEETDDLVKTVEDAGDAEE